MVIAQLRISPNISLKDCQTVVPNLSKPNFYKIKKQYKDSLPKSIQKPSRSRSDADPPKSLPPILSASDHLTNDLIEHCIVEGLKNEPTNSQLIRAAVDFVSKIKSGEKKVQELDLTKFLLEGENNPEY